MNQLLTVFGIDWRMLLAETFNFLVLLGGLSYFLYKPVMKVLAERAEKTAQGIRDAETAAKAVKEIEAERSTILSKAEHDAGAVVDRAVSEGKEERNKIVKAAQVREEAMMKDAEARATQLQERALASAEKDVTRLAVLAAEKILKGS